MIQDLNQDLDFEQNPLSFGCAWIILLWYQQFFMDFNVILQGACSQEHLFYFSPLWVFKCVLKLSAWMDTTFWCPAWVCFIMCFLRAFAQEDTYSHLLHLFNFSPLCIFECLVKLLAWEEAYLHWLHLFCLSPVYVFKCVLKLLARAVAKSHWLHLFDLSPVCVLKCVLNGLAWEDA